MRPGTWVVIVVSAIGTYVVRASFLLFANRVAAVPDSVREALRMIPAAALAALIAPALLWREDTFTAVNPRSLAGVVALVVAWRTKSVLLTIVVGLVVVVPLEAALG